EEVEMRRLNAYHVAMHKRRVNQRAIIGERTQETWKQRTMQIIRNDDDVQFLSLEWPRIGFQVCADRGNPATRCESVERGGVTVNRHDVKTARSEPLAVASLAARNIEHRAAVRDQT